MSEEKAEVRKQYLNKDNKNQNTPIKSLQEVKQASNQASNNVNHLAINIVAGKSTRIFINAHGSIERREAIFSDNHEPMALDVNFN